MQVNSKTLATQIAQILDERDSNGNNQQIDSKTWNDFVLKIDKTTIGKTITNYITKENAKKRIAEYMCRQAKKQNVLIKDLGQRWLDNIDKVIPEIAPAEDPGEEISPKASNIKGIDTSYSVLSKSKAEARAASDNRLERLDGGTGWSIVKNLFITDIPFARKFTGKILSFVSKLIGEHISVTSALGTAGDKKHKTPHKVKKKYCTHHNAENPKLDIRTNGHAKALAKKLNSTGLFSWVFNERNHLDIQIKPEIYMALEQGHELNNIMASIKNNNLDKLIT